MTETTLHDKMPLSNDERPLKQAMSRGFRRKCPSCGKGALFKTYLKLNKSCPVCHEDYTPQRTDDGPAYLTILIVGHIMAPGILIVFIKFRPDPWVLASSFIVGVVLLALFLLPRLKGALVSVQWAKRMHGFATSGKISTPTARGAG